jgi:hypothetical protein
MVARINAPLSCYGTIYYNEEKVEEKAAALIYANRFLLEAGELTFRDKMERFDRLHDLNQRMTRHTLHISLNFAPGEQLSREQLIAITKTYMDRIGFGQQPYLVYQHTDTIHPHVHVVSTSIRGDGSPIDTHNLGKNKSEPARKAIEIEYNLVKASGRSRDRTASIPHQMVQKLQYGKVETRQSIIDTLNYVLGTYKFTSLPQFNAILRLYNLHANSGSPGGRIHKNGGLVYQMLDDKGKAKGVRIKASSIDNQPGIKYLAGKFNENLQQRAPHFGSLRTRVEWVLLSQPGNLQQLSDALRKERIHLVPYSNEKKVIYDVCLVDTNHKIAAGISELERVRDQMLGRLSMEQTHHPEIPGLSLTNTWSLSDLNRGLEILLQSDKPALKLHLSQTIGRGYGRS